MPSNSSFDADMQRVQEYHFNRQRTQAYGPQVNNPELLQRVLNQSDAYPYVDGKTNYALAAAGHEPASPIAQAVAVKKSNKGYGAVMGRSFRNMVRNSFAGLMAPVELMGAGLRTVATGLPGQAGEIAAGAIAGAGTGAAVGGLFGGIGAIPGAIGGGIAGGIAGGMADPVQGTPNNPFKQTMLGQVFTGHSMGSGYIPRGEAHELMTKQQQEAASINGHALTGGRLLADSVFEPGSTAYNISSGIIDASLAIKYDPTILVGKEVKGLRAGRKKFLGRSDADKTILSRAFGMIDAEVKQVDVQKSITEAMGHQDVLAWAKKMETESSAFAVWNMTGRKMPLALADEIADAKSAQDILAIARRGIEAGTIAEKAALKNGSGIMSTMRTARSNSRMLAKMPRGGIDLIKMKPGDGKLESAVSRLDDWMKSAAFSPEQRQAHLDKLIKVKNSHEGHQVIQEAILTDFQGKLRAFGKGGQGGFTDVVDGVEGGIRKKGLGRLRENKGFSEEEITKVLGSHATARDDILRKLRNEIGEDGEVTAAVLDDKLVPIDRASTVSELIENVTDLPDVREVRRMLNPSESKAMLYTSDAWKNSVAGMDKFMTHLWRPLVLLRPAFTVRMIGEESMRMIAAGMDAPLMNPLSLIAKVITPSKRISKAAGITGDAHALDAAHSKSQLAMSALGHDKGIMSKHRAIYKTHTPEGSQAWAGHVLNLHNDDLSRFIVDDGVDAAKLYWWEGEGRHLREEFSARTGREMTRAESDKQVVEQFEWIKKLTGEDPALLHGVSTGMIPTAMDATETAKGMKWISAMDEEGRTAAQTRVAEIDAQLASKDVPEGMFDPNTNGWTPEGMTWQTEKSREARKLKAERKKLTADLEDQGHWDHELEHPLYFHGTQHTDDAGALRNVQYENDRNLVGPGFYVTENPEAASGYASTKLEDLQEQVAYWTGKDAKRLKMAQADLAKEEAKNPSVHRLTWKDPDNPPNLVNLDKPLAAPIRQKYVDELQEAYDALTKKMKVKAADPEQKQLLKQQSAELRGAIERIKAMPDDIAGYEIVNQVFRSPISAADKEVLVEMLKGAGIDGFTHTGGALSKGVRHKVSVFFDPHKLGPAQRVTPKNVSYKPKPGERGVPLKRGDGRGLINPEATNHLNKLALDPTFKSPPTVSGAKEVTAEYNGWVGKAVRFAFESLMSKPSNTFIRSPAFNQAYWKSMVDNMKLFSPEAKAQILASLDDEGVQISSRIRNSLQREADSTTGGVVEFLDADELAKANALDFVKRTFDSLTEQNALEEATRLIAPFGHAWKEASGKWARLLYEDPSSLHKGNRIMKAGGVHGEGKEGEGFFYKNDRGEWVFNYPASGLINKIVTGNPAPLQAKGTGLSMMMSQNIMPGFGPMVSIAASKFIPNVPQFDEMKQFFAPYGDPTSRGITNSVLPPWMQRAKQAFDDPNIAGLQADTTMQTARYLMSTGDYETETPEGQERLMNDAAKAARKLTGMRALATLFFPSSPTIVPMAQDKDGRTVVAQHLLKDLRAMQEKDFNSATSEFLAKYGDQGMLFLQGNTRTINPGGTDTDLGYDFLRSNPDLTQNLPLTAGLFAPPDGEFEYAAYLRSFHAGDREKLTTKQLIQLGNDKVASMIFYQAKDSLGTKINEDQQKGLATIKALLMKKYPGFNVVIGGLTEKPKIPQVISELETAVGMDKVKATPVGAATAQYMDMRKQLNAIAEARGVRSFASSKETADLRVVARKIAQVLIQQTPGFALVYDRVLDAEMKD